MNRIINITTSPRAGTDRVSFTERKANTNHVSGWHDV